MGAKTETRRCIPGICTMGVMAGARCHVREPNCEGLRTALDFTELVMDSPSTFFKQESDDDRIF